MQKTLTEEEAFMKLYGGIDLHSNNSVIVVLNEKDEAVYKKKHNNDLLEILSCLLPFRDFLQGLVVESTYNWYWLVDGLMSAGFKVHLANPAALQQYSGLKHTDDKSDARWLAHVLRLGLLPEGYICPKEERSIRDLLRKRSQLVRQKTANVLSIINLFTRNTGEAINLKQVRKLTEESLRERFGDESLSLAVHSNLMVFQCLQTQIKLLEKTILDKVKLRKEFIHLKTVDGIGDILALTIMLETGEIGRFPKAGNFASYCRCVGSKRISNGKKKGKGNTKNGNKYLAWAFVEAATFAVHYNEKVKKFYQRKKAKTNGMIAIKAVAHKLARACYYILRDQVEFDAAKAFG